MKIDLISNKFDLILIELPFVDYFYSVCFIRLVYLIAFIDFRCVSVSDQVPWRIDVFVSHLD